jgi:cytochrome c peroxidase
MLKKIVFVIAILTPLFYVSCSRDTQILDVNSNKVLSKYLNLPELPFNYGNISLPPYFDNIFIQNQDNTPVNNKITDWGATLGRVLFYDKNLSFNQTISCASCHKQEFGFSDTAQYSSGFEKGFTKRHSMSLINSRFYSSGRFFWDERAQTLEHQVLMPIQDPVEMGIDTLELVTRLKNLEYYPLLFKKAFGKEEINTDKISKALSQFVRSIVSVNSKFDDGRKSVNYIQDDFPNFTQQENRGKRIFIFSKIDCFGCHTTDAFVLDNPRNNGMQSFNTDKGAFGHSQDPRLLGSFKAPSLKSIALRNRYMHDGSLLGLDAVVEHYNSGIKVNENLDPHLLNINTGEALKMNLSQQDKLALKAFLETLTDYELMKDARFTNPFK